MTVIVINAVSVREGGSLVVLCELLQSMSTLRPQWQWHVVTNRQAQSRLPVLPHLQLHVCDDGVLGGWRIRLWYETALVQLLRQVGADLLYSMTNYLPGRGLPCPSLLLVQHAGHFSALFRRLTEAQLSNPLARWSWRLKGSWVKASVRKADRVTVQTQALARDVIDQTPVRSDKVVVIPHGCGLATLRSDLPPVPDAGTGFRIGYLTKAGVQKNFGVLLRAAALLRQQGLVCTVVLTLDPALAENRAVLALADTLGLGGCVENHGELPVAAVSALYAGLHCAVFASLCESFGFPLVESLASALPLCVADTPSNREIAGDAAFYFAADDATLLAQQLASLAGNKALYLQQAQRSLERAAVYSWPLAAERNVSLIESLLPAAGSVRHGA